MEKLFYQLADSLVALCHDKEVLLINMSAEDSDFVRFNNGKVRQAGGVLQRYLDIELINGPRHASETLSLSGHFNEDLKNASTVLKGLRSALSEIPDDPYILYAQEINSTSSKSPNKLPNAKTVINAVVDHAQGIELVGILAQGSIQRGFANSLGQRNWFASHSFNLEWSLFAHGDKAVKTAYAGFEWSDQEFLKKLNQAKSELKILSRPAKTVKPGEYRLYLAPGAFSSLAEMLCWGGFGLKTHRTKSTCLLKMIEDGSRFNPQFSFTENTLDGISPNFTSAGYVKPDRVELIKEGVFSQCLVSARAAKEYGEKVNADGDDPSSIDIAPGTLKQDDILSSLGEGIYANQLWYLNWSDMPACRLTGMTRFATFWVEDGEIVAPLNVMRFDESMYRALGKNLIGLTQKRDFFPDAQTYGRRSTGSARLPGALIDSFRFAL